MATILLYLHGTVLVAGGCMGGLCKQSPALPHVRVKSAPAIPKGHTAARAELWTWSYDTVGVSGRAD